MEQPKKRCSGSEMNKMAIKIGGGGIGAVFLLGGALATAALASSFLIRKRGRSSGENRRHLNRNTPPTATNELKNNHEQEEAKTGLQFVLLEAPSHVEKHTSVARKEVDESDSETACLVSTQILKLDKKAGIEINCGKAVAASDTEESELILSSISPKTVENEAFSEGLVINKQVIVSLGEKPKFEPKNMMHGVEIELSKEHDHYKQVYIEEKGFNTDSEEEQEEAFEKTKVDVAADGFELIEGNWGNQEAIFVVSSLSEDGPKNLNGDERGVPPSEILEIIEEDEAIEGGPEGEMEHVEEKLAEEEEQCNQTHEEIVNIEETPFEKEEKRGFGDYDKNLIVSTLAAMPKEESNDVANEKVVYQQKGQENDVEENMDESIVRKSEVEDNHKFIDSDDEADEDEDSSTDQVDGNSSGTEDSPVDEDSSSDKVDGNSSGTEDSSVDEDSSSDQADGNSSATEETSVEPNAMEPQKEKLIGHELEGNIEEHEAMKEGKCEIQERKIATTNSTRWGSLMGMLFVLSSIFCSWFLSLSSIKFCFIMFFTMVMSKVSGCICTRDRSCKRTIWEPSRKMAT